MYILYKDLMRVHHREKVPLTHLQFKTNLCNALLQNWRGRDVEVRADEEARRHLPTWSRQRRTCVLCRDPNCSFYCRAHNRTFLCLNRGCFEQFHYGPPVGAPQRQGPRRRRQTL